MMVCGVCGADWPPGAVFCAVCCTSVAQAEPRSPPVAPVEDQDPPADVPEARAAEDDGPGSCVRCGATNPRGSQRCLSCFVPLGAEVADSRSAVTLRFPWGSRRIYEGESVLLGRASESEVSTELQSFPDVSRRHAEARVRNGALVVRDLGSANGTFRNDDRLRPDVDELFDPGDRLRLGDDLVLAVGAAE